MNRRRTFMLAIVLGVWLLPLAATAGDLVTYDQSNSKDLKGLIPDNALVWVELHVPKNAKPGDYKGVVDVTVAGKPARTIGLSVTVWPIAGMNL